MKTNDSPVKIKAIFRKHFNQDGEGDDFPTDFFRPSVELTDMNFIEMRPPATFADVPCDDCGLPAVRGHRMADGSEYAYCASCDPGDEGDDTNWDITPAGPLDEKVGFGQEEWEYETDNPDAIETDLERCGTCISYERVTA